MIFSGPVIPSIVSAMVTYSSLFDIDFIPFQKAFESLVSRLCANLLFTWDAASFLHCLSPYLNFVFDIFINSWIGPVRGLPLAFYVRKDSLAS